MIFRRTKLHMAVAAATLLLGPASVYATNGYFAHGYGTASKALGGAGAGLSQDALAPATNPAGLTTVDSQFDLGWEFFAPKRGYSVTGNPIFSNEQGSDNDFFIVPSFALSYKLTSDTAVGIAAYGNGGMNTEYAKSVFGPLGTAPTGVNLIQGFIPITLAQKATKGLSLGVSVLPVIQEFKAEGLLAFQAISADSSHVTNTGIDVSTGVGYKLGAQWEVGGGVTLGAAYQPMINMTRFKKYSGLFAGWGDFDIPSNYVLGAAWKILPSLTVLFDYERINYTDVASVSNSSCTTCGHFLGDPAGPGFGWSDINVYKLGLQYVTGGMTWRAGWNHGDNPVGTGPYQGNEITFNILAPGVVKDHLTLGGTLKLNPQTDLNFSYMHAFDTSVSGSGNSFGGGTTEIHMSQNSMEMSISAKF